MSITCPHCDATPIAPRSPLARAIGAHAPSDLLTTGAQIGGALGAIKGRPGIVIGSTAGAVIGGLLSAQRFWPRTDANHCPHCGQALSDPTPAPDAAP